MSKMTSRKLTVVFCAMVLMNVLIALGNCDGIEEISRGLDAKKKGSAEETYKEALREFHTPKKEALREFHTPKKEAMREFHIPKKEALREFHTPKRKALREYHDPRSRLYRGRQVPAARSEFKANVRSEQGFPSFDLAY